MSKQSDLVSVSQGSGGDPLYIDTTNDRIGVGTSSPITLTHLKSSGDYAALTIETATTGGASYINLGDSNDQDVGQVAYYNSDDSLRVKVNATERMRIDSSGRVTMPYQPAFSATGSSGTNQVLSYNTPISLQSTHFNRGNNYNTATSKFTAPVSGVYQFNIVTYLNSNTATIVFLVNDAQIGGGDTDNLLYKTTASPYTMAMSICTSLAANDTVCVSSRENSGSSTFYIGHTTFSGFLVG